MLPLVFHSVHLSEGLLKVTKTTDVLARAQLEFFFIALANSELDVKVAIKVSDAK